MDIIIYKLFNDHFINNLALDIYNNGRLKCLVIVD